MCDCIFCQIRDKQIPAKFVYEDEDLMVFPDINPHKHTHLLIVPKKHLDDLSAIKDSSLMDKIRVVIQKMVKEQKLEGKGYRIVINGGGAQIINHLHLHLMGPMGKAASF